MTTIIAKLHNPTSEPYACDPPSAGYAAERTLTDIIEVGAFVAKAVERISQPGERRAITFTIEVGP